MNVEEILDKQYKHNFFWWDYDHSVPFHPSKVLYSDRTVLEADWRGYQLSEGNCDVPNEYWDDSVTEKREYGTLNELKENEWDYHTLRYLSQESKEIPEESPLVLLLKGRSSGKPVNGQNGQRCWSFDNKIVY